MTIQASRRPRSHAARAVLAVLSVIVGGYLAVGGRALAPEEVDEALGHRLALDSSSFVVDISRVLTHLGGRPAVASLTVLAAVALLVLRRSREAASVVLAVGAATGLVVVGKALIARPRPPAEEALTHADGFSFPSGHTATSAALYCCLALLATRGATAALRVGLPLAAAGLVTAIAASRVVLGVHHPTDVLAAAAIGTLAAVVAVGWAARRQASGDDSRPGTPLRPPTSGGAGGCPAGIEERH